MSQPQVSVIVPIYNVEEYLDHCLSTIEKQTFRDFEVLLINDGTPDNSMDIAKRYAEKDKRFLIFNKENGGLSDARNYGLERAKGEYIVFVDSDDYLHEDYLKELYSQCTKHQADMSYCRFWHTYLKSGIKMPSLNPRKSVIERDKALKMLIRDNFMHSYAWNKMYKRSLFDDNNIKYPIMYFEDVATTARLLFNANKIAVSDRYLYYYVRRAGSIMSTINAKKINDLLLSILIYRDYIIFHGEYDKFRSAINGASMKMSLVNIYSIVRQHLLSGNFKGCLTNLRTNHKLYKYLVSNIESVTNKLPDLPYHIRQPEKKHKK